MRTVKAIAEDLVNSGLNPPQQQLLDELLEVIHESPSAEVEGDDVEKTPSSDQ